MYTWWFLMFAALVVPMGDTAQEPVDEVIVVDQGVVLEDGDLAEPACCGPNEPAPPRPK